MLGRFFKGSSIREFFGIRWSARSGGVGIGVNVSDDGALGRLEPLAVFGDMGEEAHGVKNGVGGDDGAIDVFEDAFGDAAKIAATAGEKAAGFHVAIEAGATGKLVVFDDGPGIVPTNEVVFDLLAPGMTADGAFANVTGKSAGRAPGGAGFLIFGGAW